MKILAVDDNENFNNLLEIILNSEENQVTTCLTGKAAVVHCKLDIPDIVFLDMRIPGTKSVDIALEIHNVCKRAPKIVGLTGFRPCDVENEIAGSYIEYCIQKPVGLSELTKVLKGIIDSTIEERKGLILEGKL